MEYLCVSVSEDDRGYVVILKHTDIPKVFATVVTQDPNAFVMGENYVLNFVKSPGNQEEVKPKLGVEPS